MGLTVNAGSAMTLTSREQLERLHALMAQMPQADTVETSHHFCDGMYMRVYKQPPNMLVVSKVHKRENFFIVAAGSAQITTDDGPKTLKAGFFMVTKPGTKRAVLTGREGVTIITVHRVGKERRLSAIEARLVEHEDNDMMTFDNRPKPGVLVQEKQERITA